MKKFTFFSLYFSEGAPIGFIWWALPSILTKQGLTLTQTTTISAIATLPWTFKFIFGPFVDIVSTNYLKLKKQVVFYQIIMGLSLFFLINAINSQSVSMIVSTLVVHGIFAALQDICIDALAITSIPKNEIGKMNGIMQTGMLLGRSIFGGAGIYIAHLMGISFTIYFLIASVWISLIVLQSSSLDQLNNTPISIKKYLKDFIGLLNNKLFWTLIGVTYFAGFSYNGISSITSAILTQSNASAMFQAVSYGLILPISMSLGALTGGKYSDKCNPSKILKASLTLSIISSILVAIVMDSFLLPKPLLFSYFIFYFFIGSTTSSLYGFLMKNTSKKFAALEFSIFMGVVNFSESSTSMLTGQLVKSFNFTLTSLMVGVICLISLFFINKFSYLKAN